MRTHEGDWGISSTTEILHKAETKLERLCFAIFSLAVGVGILAGWILPELVKHQAIWVFLTSMGIVLVWCAVVGNVIKSCKFFFQDRLEEPFSRRTSERFAQAAIRHAGYVAALMLGTLIFSVITVAAKASPMSEMFTVFLYCTYAASAATLYVMTVSIIAMTNPR